MTKELSLSPKSPYRLWSPPASSKVRVSRSSFLNHMFALLNNPNSSGSSTALITETRWCLHMEHKTSLTLPTCDISLGLLTLPAPAAGDFVELILPYRGKWISLCENEHWSPPPPCWYDIWYDIFVNCNWVDTRWQQYSTHLIIIIIIIIIIFIYCNRVVTRWQWLFYV